MKKPKNDINIIFYWLETFLITFVAWFIMSGIFETKFIIYAVLSCGIISTVCVRTLQIRAARTDNTYFLLHMNYARLVQYIAWLVVQIAKSAWYVTRVILFHRDKISPTVVWFKADYDNPLAIAMLANSITLTPGTITIDIENGIFSVHALTRETAEGVLDGSMQKKVAWLYDEEIVFIPFTGETRGVSIDE